MRLECEMRGKRYFLFGREGRDRWPVLAPGAPDAEAAAGYPRDRAEAVALLAGFSTAEVQKAIRRAETRAQSD